MYVYIILLIIVVLLLLVLFFMSQFNTNLKEPEFPTIHSHCEKNSLCGGDLICDRSCNRCKKPIGGDCATDVDCQTGLHCSSNWTCSI